MSDYYDLRDIRDKLEQINDTLQGNGGGNKNTGNDSSSLWAECICCIISCIIIIYIAYINGAFNQPTNGAEIYA